MAENSSSQTSSEKPIDVGADSTLALYSMVDWFEKHRSQVFMGLAVAALAFIGIYGMKSMNRSKEEKAAYALSLINDKFDPDDESKSPKGDDYLKLASEQAGTQAAARALMTAGSLFFEDEKYAEAKDAFQSFIKQFGSSGSVFAENATYGLARSEEALGNNSAALSAYQKLSDASQPGLVEASRFASARLLEASGDLKAAYALYDQISLGTGYSYWTRESSVRKQEILKKDPSVKPAESATTETEASQSLSATP